MFFLVLILFFIVPFVVINITRGWKSYFVVSVPLLLYAVYTTVKAGNDGSVGSFFGLGFAYSLLAGVLLGGSVKAINLYLATKGVASNKRKFVIVLGLLVVPAYLFCGSAYYKWKHRPPSESCKYDVVSFSIAGNKFKLPGLDFISANNGDGGNRVDSYKSHISFYGNISYRKFCNKFDDGKKPAKVNMISIDFSRLGRAYNDKNFTPFCKKSNLPTEVCENKKLNSDKTLSYPSKIILYDKENYDYRVLAGGWSYDKVSEVIKEANENSCVKDMKHDGYSYYYAGTHNEEKIGFRCYKSQKKLKCSSDELLKSDVYIHLDFDVSLKSPVEEMLKVRQKTLEFVNHISN